MNTKAAALVAIARQYFQGRFELALCATIASSKAVMAVGRTPSPSK